MHGGFIDVLVKALIGLNSAEGMVITPHHHRAVIVDHIPVCWLPPPPLLLLLLLLLLALSDEPGSGRGRVLR